MRVSIIIHSVSGNLFLIASSFKSVFSDLGLDGRIYRIVDPDLHIEANDRTEVNEYYEEIISLPEANNDKLKKADVIVLGTVSLFGLPTAETKAFIDGTYPLFQNKELEGKGFYAFSSSSLSYKDGLSAIKSLDPWQEMMGLVPINAEPYVHLDGLLMPKRPSDEIDKIAYKVGKAITETMAKN